MKKSRKQKRKKIIVAILIIILLIVICVAINLKTNKKKEDNIANQEENKYKQQEKETNEKNLQIMEDGTKINISEKLKESKKIGDLMLENIRLIYKDGITTLLADIRNTSNEVSKEKEVEIIFLNEKEEKLYTLNGIIEEIEPKLSKQLNTSITADFANVYNFIIHEK